MFHLKRGGDFLPPHLYTMDRIDYQHRRNDLLNYIHQVIAPGTPDLDSIRKDLKLSTDPTEKLLLNYLILQFTPYEHVEIDDDILRQVVEEFTNSLEQRITDQKTLNIPNVLLEYGSQDDS